MPPLAGETDTQRAERLRLKSVQFRNKAKLARVFGVLKQNPTACLKVEEDMVRDGYLEAELLTSPPYVQREAHGQPRVRVVDARVQG